MNAFVQHLQNNMTGYIAVLVLALPLLIIFRKYTFPAIRFFLETCMWWALLHLVMCGLLRLIAWFKNASQGEFGTADMVYWKTPLYKIWLKKAYDPQWVFWFEIVAFFVLFAVVLRIRPIRAQKKTSHAEEARKKLKERQQAITRHHPGSRY